MGSILYDKIMAFNLGSDARLAGKSVMDNPFICTDFANSWVTGWRHVNTSWGKDAKWKIRPLPPVNRPSGT